MKFQGVIVGTAGLALLSSTGAVATDLPFKPTLLNTVVVSASRTEKELKDVAGSVAVIDSHDIEDRMAQDIRDILRYEPGVDVTEGSREGVSSVNVRGMDGNRIKMTVDGLDLASAFERKTEGGHPTYYIHGSRNFVDPETLQAVEIVKGAASSRYGSGAIGGLVAYRTKNPADILSTKDKDETKGSVKAAYSSKNEGFTKTVSLANRTGDLESMLIFTHRNTHEIKAYKGGADTPGPERGKVNPQDGKLNNVLAKLQYQLNDDHRLGLIGAFQQNQNKVDIKDHPIVPSNARGRDTKKRTRIGVFHEWKAEQLLFDKLRWQLDWQDTRTVMNTFVPAYRFVPRDRVNDYSYRETGFQFQNQMNKTVEFAGFSHNFVYGLNYKDQDINNKSTRTRLDTGASRRMDYIPEVASKSYALFFQHEFSPVQALTLKTGVRYDRYNYKPDQHKRQDSAKNTGDSKAGKLTGHLSAVYKLNEDLSAFAQFSQGFKAPNLIDMYNTVDQREVGQIVKANPNLKPEESNSFETGLRGKYAFGTFETAIFFNQYTNFIEDFRETENNPGNVFVPVISIEQKRNISKAETRGIELKGQLWLDEAYNAPEGLVLNGSVAYTEGTDKSRNRPLNSVAPLKAVIGLSYDAPSEKWGGKLDWTLVAAKKKSKIDQPKKHFATAGFGTLDLTLYYKPSAVQGLELRGGIFNLTDKKYHLWSKARKIRVKAADAFPRGDNPDRYTQPGRNFSLSVKYSF